MLHLEPVLKIIAAILWFVVLIFAVGDVLKAKKDMDKKERHDR